MTELVNLDVRSSQKNVFKKLLRSQHSAGTLNKCNVQSNISSLLVLYTYKQFFVNSSYIKLNLQQFRHTYKHIVSQQICQFLLPKKDLVCTGIG